MIGTAASVMTNSVISVSPQASLLDVVRRFVEENIHEAPVIGDEGEIKGVISTSDLLRAEESEQSAGLAEADYLREYLDFSPPNWSGDLSDFQGRLAHRTVSEVMTKCIASVAVDSSIPDIARCLHENAVQRVWVVNGKRLCGVISTFDLMPLIDSR